MTLIVAIAGLILGIVSVVVFLYFYFLGNLKENEEIKITKIKKD